MKYFYALATIVLVIGCASSSNNHKEMADYPHLVQVESPKYAAHESSKVYIDSVKQVNTQGRPALLINGSFPDACTNLGSMSQEIKNGKLVLSLSAWRNTKKMCSQVITPFSYIYNHLSADKIKDRTSVIINGNTYDY